jgi:2'-5' RNA ligase superfamily protein
VTRFAVVVSFPDLAPALDGLRERTCVSKPSHGVPPHVTLLVPGPADRGAIATALTEFDSFAVSFGTLDRFPGALRLAPDPDEPFREMTAALVAQFPDYQPYGGMFPDAAPHLTVAQADFDAAAAELEPRLPLRTRARSVALMAEARADRWETVATFTLGAG